MNLLNFKFFAVDKGKFDCKYNTSFIFLIVNIIGLFSFSSNLKKFTFSASKTNSSENSNPGIPTRVYSLGPRLQQKWFFLLMSTYIVR